jgi:hypothetical protein
MDDDAELLAELQALLATAIKCAESASDNMRFDFFDLQQQVCVGLLQAVIEYAKAILLAASSGMYYATSAMNRAALDALVDIKLACKVPGYCDSLELADAQVWMRLMEKASAGNNLLAGIADLETLPTARRMYKERIEGLKDTGVKVLSPEERFKLAEMSSEYDSAYKTLSAEAHNNLSFVRNHYFDIQKSRPPLRPRGSRPGNGNPKATLALMSEIVVDATELVLQLCGHGTAMLAPVRSGLEGIFSRYRGPAI